MAKKNEKIMTVRLDANSQDMLAKLAKWEGLSLSDIVRNAILRTYLREERLRNTTAYERLKPFIGRVNSGLTMKGPVSADGASAQARKLIIEKWEKRNAKRPR